MSALLLRFTLLVAVLVAAPSPGQIDRPTLARLSFWVPPDRMTEFEGSYREQIVPHLAEHGLTEANQPARSGPDSVFSRLFAFSTPTELMAKMEAMYDDSVTGRILTRLGETFGTSRTDGLMRSAFEMYSSPAGAGKTEDAGPGKTSVSRGAGHWRTFDATDGLLGGEVGSIYQDRDGSLWLGTWGGGLNRYDGQTFTNFTTKDGLVHNFVVSILQDRKGDLWIGTSGGLSRFDGRSFSTYGEKDSTAHNLGWALLQDSGGNIWFSTRDGGLARYDGQNVTTLTAADGLAGKWIHTAIEDRDGMLWLPAGHIGLAGTTDSAFRRSTSRMESRQDFLVPFWRIAQETSGSAHVRTGSGSGTVSNSLPLLPKTVSPTTACLRFWRIGKANFGSLLLGAVSVTMTEESSSTSTVTTVLPGFRCTGLSRIVRGTSGSPPRGA